MAQRRMFSLSVVDTDLFLDMPASTQALYFHLGMRADDDGFVASPKKITKVVNCSSDDLKLLIAKGFVIAFETGICVIRDWKQNNYIQSDRYHESIYTHEKSLLSVCENGSYCIQTVSETVSNMDTSCIQNVCNSDTEVSIVKPSIGKNSINNTSQQHKKGRRVVSLPKHEPELFERFWNLYPRKTNRALAVKAWDKLKPDMELCHTMSKALKEQMKTAQWQDIQHIPHPSTWLNNDRWMDETSINSTPSPEDQPQKKKGRKVIEIRDGEEVSVTYYD